MTPGTTADIQRIHTPYAGKIVGCDFEATVLTTQDTAANNSTVSIRKNNTTDTTVSSTLVHTGFVNRVSSTSFTAITMAAGDYFEMKVATPASWTTAPVDVNWFASVFFERD